jgi:hypothetical protein
MVEHSVIRVIRVIMVFRALRVCRDITLRLLGIRIIKIIRFIMSEYFGLSSQSQHTQKIHVLQADTTTALLY